MVKHADVPVYPGFIRIAHVSGVVQVEVTVKDGAVVSTVVKSGHPLLARVTEDNIKTWEFWPDANATFTTTFVYRIEKGEPEKSGESSNPKIQLNLPTLVKITAKPLAAPIG